ncbi:hypothetical protein [Pseudomonas sp. GM60]|uniref:hypothetical protein n=1 Tax=Pseudomonas sp. GM60 TaxID=1144334 RepID=UPI000270CCF2|nr:hypothetical protein [Pseudomonas sp. GM60]EJM73108.1 hypothetical protein PMI32_05802 [Pseudomonas sp. GM60]
MRKVIAALFMMALVGCTTAGLQEDAPAYSGVSSKTPQNLARCLSPKWQEFNSSTSSIETETGYKIAASAAFTGIVALAVIDENSTGSSVRVFLPMDWAGTQGWKDAAKTCI